MVLAAAVCTSSFVYAQADSANEQGIEEVQVTSDPFFIDTTRVSPTSRITLNELAAVNLPNTEDALAHEPSLVVRKRFIGDANGVIGMRGSHMFQTARTQVFVDGMPLHYHLQTRWNGAPRWSLISPSDIQEVEVVYGPFSSEYSGNAMGGVVNIQSRRPEQEQIRVEAGSFTQRTQGITDTESYHGYRTFLAYENRWENFSSAFSMTRLDNTGQPQSWLSARTIDNNGDTPLTNASGVINGTSNQGQPVTYIGDSGPENSLTNLYHWRGFYEGDKLDLRASIAYENRQREQIEPRLFLTDETSNTVYDRRITVGDQTLDTYRFGSSQLQHRTQERDSLLVGIGATYPISENWQSDAFYSNFRILDDVEVRTGDTPDSPNFASVNAQERARITTFDDTGWNILDLKFATESLAGDDRQRLSVGAHFDRYSLNLLVDDYNSITGQRSTDELDGNRATGRADSGGNTQNTAIFAQYGIALSEQWDVSIGLRYEDWEATDGYEGGTRTEDRTQSAWSPKFSLAYQVNEQQSVRYSVARALRFPIIEELFVNNGDISGGSVADADLRPEKGLFHNLSFEQQWADASWNTSSSARVNLFYDDVDDVIEYQTDIASGIATFLPVGRVKTQGVEAIFNAKGLFQSPLDIRWNLTYTDSEITENRFDESLIGNRMPRLPRWRSNLLMNYNLNDDWTLGGSVRYASHSVARLDNTDTTQNVFGSMDAYTFVGIKANWQATSSLSLSAGVNNLLDETAYVYHPWPGRTFHLNARYTFNPQR